MAANSGGQPRAASDQRRPPRSRVRRRRRTVSTALALARATVSAARLRRPAGAVWRRSSAAATGWACRAWQRRRLAGFAARRSRERCLWRWAIRAGRLLSGLASPRGRGGAVLDATGAKRGRLRGGGFGPCGLGGRDGLGARQWSAACGTTTFARPEPHGPNGRGGLGAGVGTAGSGATGAGGERPAAGRGAGAAAWERERLRAQAAAETGVGGRSRLRDSREAGGASTLATAGLAAAGLASTAALERLGRRAAGVGERSRPARRRTWP